MNNLYFALVRFLRRRGHDAHLLLGDDEPAHFHPSCDTFDEDYREYTHRLGWGSARSFVTIGPRRVRRALAGYDALIGCGLSAAFCARAGRPLDVFAPYGADLYLFPFGLSAGHPVKRYPGQWISGWQSKGIRRAGHVFATDFYRPYRDALHQLGVVYERVPLPPLFYPDWEDLALVQRRASPHVELFDRLRERHSLLVFSPTRHLWRARGASRIGRGKGNDVLLRGFATYREQSGDADARLVLFEYGSDVAASKELCRQLAVKDAVIWLPRMARRDLLYGAALADVGADQFPGSDESGAFGGVGIELMLLGKPVLGQLFYSQAAFRDRVGFPMPPLLHCSSPHELADRLASLASGMDERRRVGDAGRDWARTYYGDRVVERYVSAIT